MNEITKKAWQVFRSAFKDGEQVVVEDRYGKFHWGSMVATDETILLKKPGRKTIWLDWDEVMLVCHDGFPVKPIFLMTAEEAERRAAQTPTEVVRAALEERIPMSYDAGGGSYFGGGCPFVAGPCQLIEIHNRGVVSDDVDGEVLVFRADDGAIMHSYDTEHLFLDL